MDRPKPHVVILDHGRFGVGFTGSKMKVRVLANPFDLGRSSGGGKKES